MSERDAVLIPGEALNADGLFIDSVSLETLRASVDPAKVTANRTIADSLAAL